jgi:tripartite-type tricarboxylate transporter receptor subunit TctC
MDKAKPFACGVIAGLSMAISVATVSTAAAADKKVDFSGERIDVIVPFPPGGGSDVYIRAIAPHLEKQLPGKPTLIIRNVPGGGSIPGANQFEARAKPDGLHAIVTSASTVTNFVFQKSKAQFALDKWAPVLLSPQGAILYGSKSLGVDGIKDFAKLKGQKLVFGGGGPTGAEMRFTVSFELLGLDVNYVWGVARGPARLAFERGEFNLQYDTTPAYRKNALPLVKAGKAVPLFTLGVINDKGEVVRDPNFPDLPCFPEVYEMVHGKKPAGPGYEAWRALLQMNIMANKGMFLPAGTPEPILDAWRGAVARMLKDPEFDKVAATVVEGYPQFVGKDAIPIVKEATTLPPRADEWLRNFLKTKHNVKF